MTDALKNDALTNVYPFLVSRAEEDAQALRDRMNEMGYLFMKGLVPVDTIRSLRAQILELCRDAGWLDPDYDLSEGMVKAGQPPLVEGEPEYMAVYREVIHLPQFMSFGDTPALMKVAEKLLGDHVLLHRRHIGRITFPSTVYAPTPPHQDFYYIRGSEETYTCWVPLGPCPRELGGLAVWPQSHRKGYMDHNAVNLKAVVAVGLEVDERSAIWHNSDFEEGDALFFHSLTVHKALPNNTPNLLRISTDNRYQKETDEIAEGSLKPHLPSRS